MLGNLLVPTVIRRVGLGLGLTIWDLSNMIMGWATGMFGLFGVWKESISNSALNTAGVALCVFSLFFFVLSGEADSHPDVKHVPDLMESAQSICSCGDEDSDDDSDESDSDKDEEQPGPREAPVSADVSRTLEANGDAGAKGHTPQSTRSRFLVGLVLALFVGCLFGYTFDLPTVLRQCGELEAGDKEYDDVIFCQWRGAFWQGKSLTLHSKDSMNYVASHFAGIFLTGLFTFVLYVAVYSCRGKVIYTPRLLVLPSIISGLMWGVAQTAWFVANEQLGMSVAFPIISTLPGLVALACGFFFFGELQTRKSRVYAATGIALRLPGVLMIALSA
jgi:multidrug transporter EmrE-like cation transporter